MENTLSAFQTQFPLSSKKKRKKILENAITLLVFIGLILSVGLFWESVVAAHVPSLWLLMTLPFIDMFLTALLLIPYAFYVRAYIRRYYYDGADSFLTIRKGVFAPAEIHVQYQKVQDVYVDQDVLDRLMGLHDVHIASATVTSGIEAHIDGVDEATADGLKKFLLGKIERGSAPVPDTKPTMPQPVEEKKITKEVSEKTYPVNRLYFVAQFPPVLLLSSFMTVTFTLLSHSPISHGSPTSPADLGITWPMVFSALFTPMLVLRYLFLFVWIKNLRYQFLPEYIFFRSSVLSVNEKHMPYHAIQDVTVRQSIFDRLFGLASVVILDAAQISAGKTTISSSIILPGQTLERAREIVEIVKSITHAKSGISLTGL